MSDDDLIRRGDALALFKSYDWSGSWLAPIMKGKADAIAALPAVTHAAMTPEVRALVEAAIDLASWVNNNVGGNPDYLMEHLEALDEALAAFRAGEAP